MKCRFYLFLIALCALSSGFSSYASDNEPEERNNGDEGQQQYQDGAVISVVRRASFSEEEDEPEIVEEQQVALSTVQLVPRAVEQQSEYEGPPLWGRITSGVNAMIYGHYTLLWSALNDKDNDFNKQYPDVEGENLRNRAMQQIASERNVAKFIELANVYDIRDMEPTGYERKKARVFEQLLQKKHQEMNGRLESLRKKRAAELTKMARDFTKETAVLCKEEENRIASLDRTMLMFGIDVPVAQQKGGASE